MKTKETISREGALGTENKVVKILCWVQGKKGRDTNLHKFYLTKAKTTVDWPHTKSSHSVAQRSSKLGTQNKNQYGTPVSFNINVMFFGPLERTYDFISLS